jgi:hypothetical protein
MATSATTKPRILVTGTRKTVSTAGVTTYTSVTDLEVSNVVTISVSTVTQPAQYQFMNWCKVKLALPTGSTLTLANYSGQSNTSTASNFNRVGMNLLNSSKSNILYVASTDAVPCPTEGEPYFKQFTLAKIGYTGQNTEEVIYQIGQEIHLTTAIFTNGTVSDVNRFWVTII